jgi:hypothetical protein
VVQVTGRWLSESLRGLSLAMLLALSLVVSNLPPRFSFADEPSQPPTSEAATPKKAEIERPPFDLTYVPADAIGVIALRPSAIFHDPAMKPLAHLVANQSPLMDMLLPYVPFSEWKLPIQEIEQVVLYTQAIPDPKHPSGFGAVTVMIRAAHDFDWLALMRHIDPKTEKVCCGDQAYYLSHPKPGKEGVLSEMSISPKARFAFFIPDKRTLVLPSLSVLRVFRTAKKIQRPHFSWDKDWKHVEKCLIAWAADNRSERGVSNKQFPGDPFEEWTALAQKATTMVVGVDWKDGIDFRAYLTGKDHSVRDQMVRDIKAMLAKWPHDLDLEEASQDLPDEERQGAAFELQMYNDLFKHAHVTRRENTVCVHTTAELSISDLAKHFLWGVPMQEKKP